MSATSFQKLLSCLRPMLDVDNKMARKRGGQIILNFAYVHAYDTWLVDHTLTFTFSLEFPLNQHLD